ncbi:hypothetical protein C4577_03685 [Candidatus Parcubacteria bacterium]|nr:MAG: hypothetical protein C4577_03685 [Candidatus Parcubacteria bacterium]
MAKNYLFCRKCPNPDNNENCKLLIGYKYENKMWDAEERQTFCKSCTFLGNRNPFFGKNHTEETKEAMSKIRIDLWESGVFDTPEVRFNMSQSHIGNKSTSGQELSIRRRFAIRKRMMGENNHFYGKNHTHESRKKISKSREGKYFGENNPFYGRKHLEETKELCREGALKSKGSGHGISGKYNGLHFRSTCELLFLKQNYTNTMVSAEAKGFRCEYIDSTGKLRYHYPDFVDGNVVYEIKPFGWERDSRCVDVPLKRKAAEKIITDKGFKYVFIEMKCISKSEVFALFAQGKIDLDTKWKKQYYEKLGVY